MSHFISVPLQEFTKDHVLNLENLIEYAPVSGEMILKGTVETRSCTILKEFRECFNYYLLHPTYWKDFPSVRNFKGWYDEKKLEQALGGRLRQITFNINNPCRVVLSEKGLEILKEYWKETLSLSGGKQIPGLVGFVFDTQVWVLMEIFGPHLSIGMAQNLFAYNKVTLLEESDSDLDIRERW